MPLIDLPARLVLKLPGQTDIAWAVFDSAWYLAHHRDACHVLDGASPEQALAYYLTQGQQAGHSPNMFFDEAWHRRSYPAIAEAIAAGVYESAFDAYCRGGSDRAAHWLFDETQYRRRYPDLSEAALVACGAVNGYDHFLRHGDREGRVGHTLFDPAFYAAAFAPDRPFQHYLAGLWEGRLEQPTSVYFDPAWYLAQYPDVARAITNGTWRSALHHYLTNASPTEFDPLPAFSERYYLARNPDLATVVQDGQIRNGYAHFLRYGISEARSPCEALDLGYYGALEEVRADLGRELASDCFAHWLAIGRGKGLHAAPPDEERISEAQAKTLFRRKAAMLRPLLARVKPCFATDAVARVTVIMVLHDRFELTMMALASLPPDVALVLVDSGSTDETRAIGRYVDNATLIRFDENIGFLRGANAAIEVISAEIVLLLNNDVELAAGAVEAALRRLDSDGAIGAVGGKVVRTHGMLQEAGSIIWRDGSTQGYLRDQSPLAPEANFVRQVDYCSAVFLLVRGDLLRTLGGFDEAFAPAYYEDADLCVRIAQAGHRVIYDPSVVIHHLEYGSASSSRASEAAIAERRAVFVERHAGWLARRLAASGPAALLARSVNAARRRVLFIEDQLPLRSLGSGFVRSNDILRTMASLGYAVTVFPLLPSKFDLAAVYADMPDTAEVMHDRSLERLEEFLLLRAGYYDAVWVARTHNLPRIRPMLDRLARVATVPPVILDSEAIAATRDGILGSDALNEAVRTELAEAHGCARLVAVSEADALLMREAGFADPVVLGHMRSAEPTPRPFTRRSGMLFVGAIHRQDSPNYDSLCWFIEAVLPLVEQALGWETRLTVVGYKGDGVALDRFADHPRVTLRGAVDNTMPLYDQHRLFVAPTRIAAGAPYKVHEAASYGLPVVATELLRGQLGWNGDEDLLAVDDPAAFAAAIVRLYRDESLWQRLRENALGRVTSEAGQERYAARISDLLGPLTVARQAG